MNDVSVLICVRWYIRMVQQHCFTYAGKSMDEAGPCLSKNSRGVTQGECGFCTHTQLVISHSRMSNSKDAHQISKHYALTTVIG